MEGGALRGACREVRSSEDLTIDRLWPSDAQHYHLLRVTLGQRLNVTLNFSSLRR